MSHSKMLKKQFEEEYDILKKEEEFEELKKTYILIIVCAVTLIITIISATFSFYSNKVKSNDTVLLEAKHQFLTINYETSNIIEIDKVNKFTIQNNGDLNAQYKIEWTDVTNKNLNDLKYTLKKNGVVMVDNQVVPSTNSSIIDGLEINSHDSITFELTVVRENPEVELKDFNAKIYVTIIN